MQWVHHLRRRFGRARVEDLLQGTGLESWAAECGFGMHLVRSAVPEELLPRLDYLETVMDDISAKSLRYGRAVAVQGNRPQRWYRSVQATVDNCMCKYKYEATKRHEVYKVEDIPVLKEMLEWVHSLGDIRLRQQFNEILGNVYMRDLDECVTWHSDANTLYSESTDVLSVSGSALGLFCFQPRITGFVADIIGKKWNVVQRDDFFVTHKLRGLVPLFPGDVLLMSGTCQQHLDHETLKFSALKNIAAILKAYPATSAISKVLLSDEALYTKECLNPKRTNITLRRIENHLLDPRCPSLPANTRHVSRYSKATKEPGFFMYIHLSLELFESLFSFFCCKISKDWL